MLAIPSRALSDLQLVSAYGIFLASYLVFAIGKFPGLKINRPAAAMIGAVAMIACGAVSADDALYFIDFPTLVLLFSMMLIVGNLHLVGFFEWNAELLLRRLNPSRLLPAVIFTTGFLSAVFVNDIVCLVMVPFVLTVTKRMRIGPLPYLLAVATSSNIGSVATITGNPQNMLIGSFSRISYRDFFLHLGPVALVGLFLNWAVLYWLHMRRPGASVTGPAKIPVPAHDPTSFRKPAVVVGVVVIGFFAGVPPAMMAALGAAALLITRTLEPKRLYDEVDWGLLVFFIGLFLIVGGAENVGIVGKLLGFAEHWNIQRLPPFLLTVSVLSNLVSNVPAVMLLKSLIPGFANPRQAWLALAMSSTLAGNLTITGSVANIIVVERARPEVEIGFGDYLRAGLPITLATLLWGWGWLAWFG
ncbi:MAG TPA: anion transporter [Terriglobales bacterium]|nr:anion transporter [Terriglobales bacterium]